MVQKVSNKKDLSPERQRALKRAEKKYLTDEILAQIGVAAGYDLSLVEITAILPIPKQHFELLRVHSQIVIDTYDRGRILTHASVGKALVNQAKKGNMAAIMWYEKTRRGKSDRIETKNENTNNNNGVTTNYVIAGPVPLASKKEWAKVNTPNAGGDDAKTT